MNEQSAILWQNPGRGTCITRVSDHIPPRDNPSPFPVGAVVRHADMLGVVLPDREIDGVPIAASSVAVRCTHSLGRFPDLDKKEPNVWTIKLSQVLTGELLAAAQQDPEALMRRFMALEAKVREQEAAERAAQRAAKKRPPGKPKKRLPGKGR